MKVIRKFLVILCLLGAASPVLVLGGLSQYYYSTRPREPHPEAGRTYVERVKGASDVADVYLTRREHLPFDYAIYIHSSSMLFVLAAFLLNERWKVFANPTYTRQKKFH